MEVEVLPSGVGLGLDAEGVQWRLNSSRSDVRRKVMQGRSGGMTLWVSGGRKRQSCLGLEFIQSRVFRSAGEYVQGARAEGSPGSRKGRDSTATRETHVADPVQTQIGDTLAPF